MEFPKHGGEERTFQFGIDLSPFRIEIKLIVHADSAVADSRRGVFDEKSIVFIPDPRIHIRNPDAVPETGSVIDLRREAGVHLVFIIDQSGCRDFHSLREVDEFAPPFRIEAAHDVIAGHGTVDRKVQDAFRRDEFLRKVFLFAG